MVCRLINYWFIFENTVDSDELLWAFTIYQSTCFADFKYRKFFLLQIFQKHETRSLNMNDKNNYNCTVNPLYNDTVCTKLSLTLLRYRMAGITESAMVAYTHKYAVV